MDKPWYKSKTAWGGLLIGVGMIFTAVGKLLVGDSDANAALVLSSSGVGVILVAVGLRDAIGKNH